ncbi:hypothetical protein ANCCAN_18413 [Ancylostoma caninum]|uniref:Uncharacterized protein n=1 Tax=Ancylostoma caninum TaxID=29170 RepID=A0A368FXK0_ANCCA|nr:hypothetical protein ANCCAN_18413 [Ancylostoma caninum]
MQLLWRNQRKKGGFHRSLLHRRKMQRQFPIRNHLLKSPRRPSLNCLSPIGCSVVGLDHLIVWISNYSLH